MILAAFVLAALLPTGAAGATTDCTFTDDDTTMTLDGNCTTDQTIYVPDGWTLDGDGYTITAVDPAGFPFVGAVIANAGAEAHVTDVTVTASGLANACHDGAERLRGIMFDGASGSITGNTVVGINQGASGCPEGNGIEVRNAPFDGTHPNTANVEITDNYVDDYQKTGIVVNGDVVFEVTDNYVGSADLKDNIAANSIQIAVGAFGTVEDNTIVGNQWDVVSNPQWIATAILLWSAGDVSVVDNTISGDGTDVGIAAFSSGTVIVEDNEIGRTGPAVGDTVDAHGVGVEFWNNSWSELVDNTFTGWNVDQIGADLDEDNETTP